MPLAFVREANGRHEQKLCVTDKRTAKQAGGREDEEVKRDRVNVCRNLTTQHSHAHTRAHTHTHTRTHAHTHVERNRRIHAH